MVSEQGQTHSDLVDGASDTAGGDDDDFGAEQFGNTGIGQAETTANTGVPRTLNDDHGVFFKQFLMAADDLFSIGTTSGLLMNLRVKPRSMAIGLR